MKAIWTGFHSVLSDGIEQFIAHKRTLDRRYDVEEKTLRLFDRYLTSQKVEHLRQVTPSLIEAFLASRPRKQARSYNHLLSTVRRLFDWLFAQGIVERSPVQTATRRQTAQRIPFIFDRTAARRLLDLATGLPDNPRALMRGTSYHAIFAILYGLGLRVGEVCRLRQRDIDLNVSVRRTHLCTAEPRRYCTCRKGGAYGTEDIGVVDSTGPVLAQACSTVGEIRCDAGSVLQGTQALGRRIPLVASQAGGRPAGARSPEEVASHVRPDLH